MVGFCTSLIRSGTSETEPNPASAFSDARWPSRASMSPHGSGCRSARAPSSCSMRPMVSSNRRMFAPEQNEGSRPVSTSTRSASFDSNASSSAYSSAAISVPSAFRVDAWSSVTSTTPSARWASMNSLVAPASSQRGVARHSMERPACCPTEHVFKESTVPFLVEARDWARLSESFHEEIERTHIVMLAGA